MAGPLAKAAPTRSPKPTKTTSAENFQRAVSVEQPRCWRRSVNRRRKEGYGPRFRASAHARDLCRRGECRRASSPQPLPGCRLRVPLPQPVRRAMVQAPIAHDAAEARTVAYLPARRCSRASQDRSGRCRDFAVLKCSVFFLAFVPIHTDAEMCVVNWGRGDSNAPIQRW